MVDYSNNSNIGEQNLSNIDFTLNPNYVQGSVLFYHWWSLIAPGGQAYPPEANS